MKKILLTIAYTLTLALAACTGSNSDVDELGKLSMAVTSSTATHTYRLQGTVQLYQGGVFQQSVDISANQPSVILDDLVPGNYDVFLQGASLLKDGAAVTSTMTSANPHPVTVVAGSNTVDEWKFNVAGDPVVFTCSEETCGRLEFTVNVTEVPPAP